MCVYACMCFILQACMCMCSCICMGDVCTQTYILIKSYYFNIYHNHICTVRLLTCMYVCFFSIWYLITRLLQLQNCIRRNGLTFIRPLLYEIHTGDLFARYNSKMKTSTVSALTRLFHHFHALYLECRYIEYYNWKCSFFPLCWS